MRATSRLLLPPRLRPRFRFTPFGMSAVAFALAFALSAHQAPGATYWVAMAADNGDDAHAGSEQAPFATLDAALAVADDGDTIRVRAGTYPIPAQTVARNASYNAASRPAWWVTNAVAIVGDGPDATFFDGADTANRYAFLLDNADASISGVAVKRVKSEVAYKLQESALIHVEKGIATNCVARDSTCFYVGGISTHLGRIVDCVVSNVTCTDSESMGAGFVATGMAGVGGGVISNCQAYACTAKRGAGIYLSGINSAAYDCLVIGCTTVYTSRGNAGPLYVAASGALASHCVVTNNQGVGGGGATVVNGTLRNCLVAFNRNTDKTGGGGVSLSKGTVDSCTIAQNMSESIEGAHGLYQTGGTVVNTIVAFNNAAYQIYDPLNHVFTSGTCTYTCTYPEANGAGNTAVEPLFADRASGDFRLSDASPLFDRGLAQSWMATATDLDGRARISGSAPNPGAYEDPTPEHPPFSLSLLASAIAGATPLDVTFSATPVNAPAPAVSYLWEINGAAASAAQSFTHTFAQGGIYTVRCIAESGGVTVTNVFGTAIEVRPRRVYVSNDGSGTWPCETPATATNDLMAALGFVAAPPGGRGEIYVLEGTYYPKELLSISGGSYFVIGSNAVFSAAQMTDKGNKGLLYINAPDTIVSGLTFRDCTAMAENYGACITLVDGVVSNCVVTDNSGTGWASGAVRLSGGLFTHGVIRNNTNNDGGYGGGGRAAFNIVGSSATAASGTIAFTFITNNTSTCVGAGQISAAGVITNCVISGNSASTTSSGARAGALHITGAGMVVNTRIEGNTYTIRGENGGTVFLDHASALLRNCLVAGSDNERPPAVRVSKGTLENCTVAGNAVSDSAASAAGVIATSSATLLNTIVWGNTVNGAASDVSADGATVTTCLFADPHFRDAPASRHMLKSKSPARNTGTFQGWMDGAVDLSGLPRVLNGAVDMGCFECALPFGAVLSVR